MFLTSDADNHDEQDIGLTGDIRPEPRGAPERHAQLPTSWERVLMSLG